MTFNALQKSVYLSEPVELYVWTVGTTTYRETSAELDIPHSGNTYASTTGLSWSGGSQSGEDAKDEVRVTVDWSHPVFQLFLNYVPQGEVSLTIYGLERGDTVDQELIHIWSGVWVKEERNYPEGVLIFKPVDFGIRKPALCPKYGPNCQWSQFSGRCGLVEASWSTSYTVGSVSGLVVSISGVADDDNYRGGMLVIGAGSSTERAWIVSQAAGQVTLDRDMPSLAAGVACKLTKACRGEFSRCDTVFSNRPRFLGAPYADKVNPHVGDGVRGDK